MKIAVAIQVITSNPKLVFLNIIGIRLAMITTTMTMS